ncbi:MAG: autotransporter outer membrane beta-barrel domain-containing protein, partial [Brevundimonas sp.]|uniref:autotransporter outer membrane beta-barrel domain-containing protein n=1 Tax=Brevundimonas sp. TaxID=1871086 RepID=UPI0011F9AABE
FVGLERLNNSGVIDLTNSVAGDVFTLDGVLNGQTGGRIGLDLDLRGAAPVADRIVAGGFMGVNEVVLTLQGRASLGDAGVVIAESAMAQTGQEMTVRVAGGGFIGFDLAFTDGEYRISGELAPPAFEPTKVATGAQHQWTSGADVVSARFEQMRDGGRRGDRGDQVWAQVYGGSNDIEAKRAFDLMGESIDADLSHEVKSQGVQAGVDRAVALETSDLVFGMLAGAGKTELRFQNGDVTEYDGVGVGAYGHWFSGPLSIGVLAKLDTFKLDYDWAEANLKTRSNGFTTGARIDAAWRIEAGQGWYVEPQASLSWSDTALGRMKARDGAEVVFGDTTSLVGRIGMRAGAEMTVANGLSFKPFAAVHALNEFDGDNASTLLLGDEAVGVTDRAHGAWGRAVLGASLDAPSGLGGFIQAEGDFGEVEGFTARAGIKFSW